MEVAFACGHIGTVVVDTKKNGDPADASYRRWYAEKREEKRDCLECWKKKNPLQKKESSSMGFSEAILDEMDEKMHFSLPMDGTDSQVTWARKIRLETFVSTSGEFLDVGPDFEIAAAFAGDANSAKWWIENKETLNEEVDYFTIGVLIAEGVDSGEATGCENPY